MINKNSFIDFLEKAYLNSLTDALKIKSTENTLQIKFINNQEGFTGDITNNTLKNIFPIGEYGIFNVKKLIKSLSILGDNVKIDIHESQEVPQVEFKDSHTKLQFTLSDLLIIKPVPNIEEPEYEIEFELDKKSIETFIKGKNAMDSEVFCIGTDFDNSITILIGDNVDYSDKISFNITPLKPSALFEPIPFNAEWFKEIISHNKNFTSNKILLSKKGLMKIEFIEQEGDDEKSKSIYYLIRNQN
jgi:hypothetical protein